MSKTNLNAMCNAVLTEYGAKLWNAQFEKTPPEYKPEKVKAGDTLKAQLWELMQVYGAGFFNGMPSSKLPFVDNEIEILESK